MPQVRFWMRCFVIQSTALGLVVAARAESQWIELFAGDEPTKGWVVTEWSDLKKPAPQQARWEFVDDTLLGSVPRGTWLVSEAEYGDFELEFEWRLGPRGNGGVALRSPMRGDPAFDGLELQMVDPRYFPADQAPKPSELTGSFYRAAAPRVQVFKPEDWNLYEIVCRGPGIKVVLNGELIQDLNLDEQIARPLRHDGSEAPTLKDRPRRGHIGFQELSRGGGRVEIRRARIRTLD
ncbi:MAG: DUF1080 domain-containing protein [Pirellulales bacterium]|nr:DUF1080 domain-containing protein [Pirellulales bacterium]